MKFTKTNIDRLMTNFFNDEWKGKQIEDMTIFLNAFWEHYNRDMYSIASLDLGKYGYDFYPAIWSDMIYGNLEERCINKPLHIYYVSTDANECMMKITKEKSEECNAVIATVLKLPFGDRKELVLDLNDAYLTENEMTVNEYIRVFCDNEN